MASIIIWWQVNFSLTHVACAPYERPKKKMTDPSQILILYYCIFSLSTPLTFYSVRKKGRKRICTSGGNGRAAHLALPTRIQKKHTATTTNKNNERKKKKKQKRELEREKRFSISLISFLLFLFLSITTTMALSHKQ